MVKVYLPIEGRQILLLSVPSADIKRFSYHPLKWLRFVTFAICGAHGDLSVMPNGPRVDYDTPFDRISDAYYFNPQGRNYQFIDYNAMNNRITSSTHTPRDSNFRKLVMERDGPVCVFTGTKKTRCEAVHLLPKSKGDEYIQVFLQDRLDLYSSEEPRSLNIDSVENGIFLRKELRTAFKLAECAFLKTPNFALNTADIPRVETGPMPSSRLTLHFWEPETGRMPVLQYDAYIDHTGVPLALSTLILDFVYGVAVYQHWGGGENIQQVLSKRFADHFESISPQAPLQPDGDSSPEPDVPDDGGYTPDNNSSPQPNDKTDSDYIPYTQQRGRNQDLNMSDNAERAMDDVLALSMLLKGTSPERVAAERRRREEVEELQAKEASRVRVEEWIQKSSSTMSDGDISLSNAAISSYHEQENWHQ